MNMRLLSTFIVLALSTTIVLAQKTTLQLQDASGDRLIIETGTLTATRVATLPDASGMLMVGGSSSLDDLSDAMNSGPNFTGSVLLGNQIAPTSDAQYNTGVGTGVFSSSLTGSFNVAVGRFAALGLTAVLETLRLVWMLVVRWRMEVITR